MNKKILFTLMPCALAMVTLSSCNQNNPTLDSISASCSKTAFKVNDIIKKDDIVVEARYSNNEVKNVTNWTCEDFKNDSYTFTKEDAGKDKEFTIKLDDKDTTLKVAVDKMIYYVTFKDGDKVVDTQSIVQGECANAPEGVFGSISKVFDGWYNEDTKFDFTTPINSDLTLTSKYIDFTEKLYQESIDAVSTWSENRNLTLNIIDYDQGKNYEATYKILKNTEYIEYKDAGSTKTKYEYYDGVNSYGLAKVDNKDLFLVSSICDQANAFEKYSNLTEYSYYTYMIKYGFYNSFKDITFDSKNGLYNIELSMGTSTFNPRIIFEVINGKDLRMKTVDLYLKNGAEEYKLNKLYKFSNYGSTKETELTPNNLVKLENISAGECSATIDVENDKSYYLSLEIPSDLDQSKNLTLSLKDSKKNDIQFNDVSGKEVYLDKSFNFECSSNLNATTAGSIDITNENVCTRLAIKVSPNTTETLKDATFSITYETI